MTGFDFATLAREAREQVRPGEPPLDAITSQPARPRGRWIAFGAAAAVVLVIGTVVALPRGSSGPEPTPSVPSIPGLVPPAGMRWVGAGRVVLAVPTTWADSQYGCETDPRPSVVYDAGYWTTCQDTSLGRERRPAALWVLPTSSARSGYGGFAYVRAHEAVPRLHARRSKPFSQGGDAGRYWYQALIVPSVHTMFVAQGHTRAAVVATISSARRTPHKVVVPTLAAGQDLAAARAALSGYDVRVETVPGFYRADSVIGSDPAFGTPLARGATINLTVSSGLGDRPSMSDAFLARQGVRIEPLGTISPAEQTTIDLARNEIEDGLAAHSSPWDTQYVLRRITADYPSRHGVPEFQHRLAWLALTPHLLGQSLGGPCCGPSPAAGVARDISVYDALTGKFIWGESF
jgi:hypothetical protein